MLRMYYTVFILELNFYIVRHLQFTTGALPPTASAEKIELPATQPSRPGCRKIHYRSSFKPQFLEFWNFLLKIKVRQYLAN